MKICKELVAVHKTSVDDQFRLKCLHVHLCRVIDSSEIVGTHISACIAGESCGSHEVGASVVQPHRGQLSAVLQIVDTQHKVSSHTR